MTVDGITAQGQVVWYSVAREVAEDDVATLVRRSGVRMDDDGDGKVSWDLEGEVPTRSIWVAVDLATGRVAVATPEGYPLRRVGWRGRGLGRDNARADRVEDLRTYADVLLVRPGEGAWRLTAGDGSDQDDDGAADGKLAVALDRMRPVEGIAGAGEAVPPARFGSKDVVVLIDPNRMELTVENQGVVREPPPGSSTVLFTILLLSALSAGAQQHPNTARGFGASGTFNPGDVDSVNLFNGNLVIRIPIGQTYPVNGALSYGLVLVYNNNVWDYQQDDPGGGGGSLTQAIPNRTSNAGLGWMVSLGRLNPPSSTDVDTNRTAYMSPDGALHTFYPTLHEGETAVSGVQYTRDGTYLRYKSASNEIELPDGTIHHFDAQGFPDLIKDRFGNQLMVTYTANLWTLSDGHRVQRVWFRTDLPPFNPVVDRIELAAFGGPPAIATWRFRYSNDDGIAAVRTGCRNTDPGTANAAVPLLTQVTLPDGSFYRMAASDYGTQTATPCDSGMLRGMTLPTLGRIEWDYMEYVFPPPSSSRGFRQKSTGVARRRLKDAASQTVGEWSYATALTSDPNYPYPQELVNTVVTPLGDKTVNYFSVSASSGGPSGWSVFDYGLPFTRYVTDGGSVTRYLSSRVYDCDTGAANCQLKRTNFVSYDRDAGAWSATLEENTRKNQRAFTTRTNYDDSGLLEAVVFSDFDGLGHYRETNLYGNFGSGDTRTAFVNYNPGQSYPGGFTPPPASSPWVLNTYTETFVAEPQWSPPARMEHCFDSNTGFLLRTRTYASTGNARSANDVVMRYTPANGNVAIEESFRGRRGRPGYLGASLQPRPAGESVPDQLHLSIRSPEDGAGLARRQLQDGGPGYRRQYGDDREEPGRLGPSPDLLRVRRPRPAHLRQAGAGRLDAHRLHPGHVGLLPGGGLHGPAG